MTPGDDGSAADTGTPAGDAAPADRMHEGSPAAGVVRARTWASTAGVADALSIASDFGAAWVALAALQVVTRRTSATDAARRLGVAGLVSLVLTRWLKHRYAVPRELVARETAARTPTSNRFPSGHTLAAFTSALVVPRSTLGRGVAVCFAGAVAWARVRLGHHRPADVVAGAAVGTVAGSAIAVVLRAG
jgi:membrane-associated phospholipid phosphatase